MTTIIVWAVMGVILLWGILSLAKNPTRDDHFTRLTVMRCKLIQEDIKHKRPVGDYRKII